MNNEELNQLTKEELVEKCLSLQRQLDVINRKLVNAKSLTVAHEEYSKEAKLNKDRAKKEAAALKCELRRTRDKFGLMNNLTNTERVKESLVCTKKEMLRVEEKLRRLYLMPFTDKSKLSMLKEKLNQLYEQKKSEEARIEQLQIEYNQLDELKKAVVNRDVSRVRTLVIDQCVSVNIPDELGFSAFQYACKIGDVSIVKCMIEKADLLISSSTDDIINTRGLQNSSPPLILAAEYGHDEVIDILLTNGADPNSIGRKSRNTLHTICASNFSYFNNNATSSIMMMMDYILPNIQDIDATDDEGNTALHLCCIFNNNTNNSFDKAKLLVGYGARIDIENGNGLTAREVAVQHKAQDIANLLLR